jgi:hypothetical protein
MKRAHAILPFPRLDGLLRFAYVWMARRHLKHTHKTTAQLSFLRLGRCYLVVLVMTGHIIRFVRAVKGHRMTPQRLSCSMGSSLPEHSA